MAYEFPKHVLKSKEVLDPDKLTSELSPATEQLSGQLNSNNLSGKGFKLDRNLMPYGSVLRYGYAYHLGNADFRYEGVGSGEGDPAELPKYPSSYITGSHWNTKLATAMTISQPCRLWISGIAQYLWYAFVAQQRPPFPGHCWQYGDLIDGDDYPTQYSGGLNEYPRRLYGARVQWAIRVNGMIVTESITGCMDDNQQATVPIKLTVDRLLKDDQFPGPSGEKTPQRSSLGVIAWPSRIGCTVDVPVGRCVVELVCRRLKDSRFEKQYGLPDDDTNYIGVFNVSQVVFQIPTRVGSAPTYDSVDVPAFGDQELFGRGTLYRSRLQVLENTLGSLRPGNLQPGALRPEHFDQGVVVDGSFVSLHAMSDYGYSGFLYQNRRPDRELAKTLSDEGEGVNPNRQSIVYDTSNSTGLVTGWAMWGVKNSLGPVLDEFDALLYDHDYLGSGAIGGGMDQPESVTGTNNSYHPDVIRAGEEDWRNTSQGWACLRKEFKFHKNRRRGLLITADVQLLSIIGNYSHFVKTDISAAKGAYANAGMYAFFRLGYHKKGDPDKMWTILTRSEVFVNYFNNWRRHPLVLDDSAGGAFKDVRPLPSHGNVSLQVLVTQPWYEQQGAQVAPFITRPDGSDVNDALTDDYTIDGVALFVAGAENFTMVAPRVGLSGANLSASLIDFGAETVISTHMSAEALLLADSEY